MTVPFQLDEFYLDIREDGNKVHILSQEEIARGPFPGLRPFKTSEFQLFYGRTGQGEELTKRLKKNHFLAVIGSSGTGKSSLVRAGLIPQLFGGYLHGAGSKWDIAICRPGKDPVENLAVALAASRARSKDNDKVLACYNEIAPGLNESLYGLLDAKKLFDKSNDGGNDPSTPSNLLVIVDQFEELFRFDRKDLGKENIENQFVNLLLKAVVDPARAVYVIITMRSEFLGDCVKYRGLPEAINEGQYLVPQLTRNELKEVIESPVKLAGKTISPNLVELLINEIEESKLKENLDQLPILQHALMRTYNNAAQEGPTVMIDVRHYEAIGEMNKALANHAEDKFRQLGDAGSSDRHPSKKQQLAKIIFQSLTELSSDKKSGRRPTELKKIYDVAAAAGASEKEVDEVVNHFRDADTSFIMPPINTALNPDIILDISHESLMRNWARLNEWLTEEMKYKALYRQLNERRQLHEDDNEEWLRGTLLRELLDWRMSYANTATWATRYQRLPGDVNDAEWHLALYKSNLSFLNESEIVHEKHRQQEAKELKENIAREQRTQSAKNRIKVLTAALLVSGLFAVWAFNEKSNSDKQEKRAVENAQEAKYQKEISDSIAKKSVLQKIEADSLRQVADRQRVIANNNTMLADEQRKKAERLQKQAEDNNREILRQKIELEKYAKMETIRKEEAVKLGELAREKSEKYEDQLVKNALQEEDFYTSKYLDQATKEEIMDSLYEVPLFNAAEIDLGQKKVDTSLLRQINNAVWARENVVEYPANSLETAKNAWSESKHPLIKKILLDIVNDNVFSSQSEDIVRSYQTYSRKYEMPNLGKIKFAVSGHNDGFAINIDSQLVSGKLENNRLQLNETSFDNSFSSFFCSAKQNSATKRNIDWVSYVGGNTVALVDSSWITLNPEGKIKDTSLLHGLVDYESAQLSPDGKLLLLTQKDGKLLLRNTPASNEKVDTLLGDYKGQLAGTDGVFFSPNSQYIFLNVKDRPRIFNKRGVAYAGADGKEPFSALGFSQDSLVIVAASGKLTVRDILMKTKTSEYEEINLNGNEFSLSSIEPGKISSINLSKNWKRMLLAQKDGKLFLLENKNGDSLFVKNDSVKNNARIKRLGSGRNQYKASFYNDSTVISLNDDGEISVWPLYRDFTDPDSAVAAVMPRGNLTDSLYNGKAYAGHLLDHADATALNKAADFYFNRQDAENIDTAKMLYKKLLDNAPAEMRLYYLSKITETNLETNRIGKMNTSYNNKAPDKDKIREYRLQRAIRLKENVENLTEMKNTCIADSNRYDKLLSEAYGSLAFNLLFINDIAGAIASAKKGMELYPANDWINTNLALGYLLSGDYAAAEKIYTGYKYKIFADRSRTFKDAFIEDIKALENAGVVDKSQRQVRQSVESIKKMLDY